MHLIPSFFIVAIVFIRIRTLSNFSPLPSDVMIIISLPDAWPNYTNILQFGVRHFECHIRIALGWNSVFLFIFIFFISVLFKRPKIDLNLSEDRCCSSILTFFWDWLWSKAECINQIRLILFYIIYACMKWYFRCIWERNIHVMGSVTQNKDQMRREKEEKNQTNE